MKGLDIKSELRQLIDQENDIRILEAIRVILKKSTLNPVLKEKLTVRALKAEDDIKDGRLFSRNEFIEELNKKLGT